MMSDKKFSLLTKAILILQAVLGIGGAVLVWYVVRFVVTVLRANGVKGL